MDFPEQVRYDERLTAFAKLLFYEIQHRIGNKQFAVFTVSEMMLVMNAHFQTVNKSLHALQVCGHIRIEKHRAGTKWERRFYISNK